MKALISAEEFWRLRCLVGEANTKVEALKREAQATERARDRLLEDAAAKYGFDWKRPFVMDDADCSVTQEPA